MFNNIFPLVHSWLLIGSFLFAFVSIWLHYKQQYKKSVFLLFIAALLIRLFVAHLDPFLHDWDERYHALVARNMMHHPFKPMLYARPIVPYDIIYWTSNHIWLHKQPLFLWQMAVSMKLFGVSEFSIRYPSVLLGALGVVLVYRIAYLLTNKSTTALLAALLTCFSHYHLEVVSGYWGMDGNDISFECYILASIWTYAEYLQNRKIKWVILLGVFAGCAVLNKWLTGLLIYASWAINIIWNLKDYSSRKELFHFFTSLFVCTIVFLPWQLFIFYNFPSEALYEYNYNTKHLTQVVEGHGGDSLYYFNYLPTYFSEVLWYLLPIGIVYALFKKKDNSKLYAALIVSILLVYTFFSFIVPTKMHTYFMACLPVGYIFIAMTIDDIILFPLIRKYLFLPLILLCTILIFRIPEITIHHNPDTADKLNRWKTKAYNTIIYKQLKQHIPSDTKIVINCSSEENIDVMFYNNDVTAYPWCLTEKIFSQYIQQPQLRVCVFTGHKEFGIPKYVSDFPKAFIIQHELK